MDLRDEVSRRYFGMVRELLPAGRRDVATFVVAHVLPSQPHFLDALRTISPLAGVLPKPRSIDGDVLPLVRRLAPCDPLNREDFSDATRLASYLESRAPGAKVVLCDVGGYFAPGLVEASSLFSGRIVGVVEDTENGHRRYEQLEKLPCPVYSVARSPLKEPEDRLVGDSIVFSTEALLRQMSVVMPGLWATIIGYGKIGSSICSALRGRGVHVGVAETNPIRLAQAVSAGYAAVRLPDVLARTDLLISATGTGALALRDLAGLAPGAFVASATSADDEFDVAAPGSPLVAQQVGEHVTRYHHTHGSFHLLHAGNAVNFLHGSAVGPAIHLVQAEILAALSLLATEPHPPGFHEVGSATRRELAAAWIDCFHPAIAPIPEESPYVVAH